MKNSAVPPGISLNMGCAVLSIGPSGIGDHLKKISPMNPPIEVSVQRDRPVESISTISGEELQTSVKSGAGGREGLGAASDAPDPLLLPLPAFRSKGKVKLLLVAPDVPVTLKL